MTPAPREPGPMQRAARIARDALSATCVVASGGALLAVVVSGTATAQGAPAAQAGPGARPGATAPAREEGPRWQSLTPAQRESLAPLERDWPSIDASRKQKWLAIAARFKTLTPAEKDRITARMSEWARLTPEERGQARFRFEEARQLPAPDRSARWEAYQALPPDQRERLAERAATGTVGARDAARPVRPATTSNEAKLNLVPNPAYGQPPKPVAPTLVQVAPGATTTPVTRQPAPPPHQQSGMPKIAATPELVNRSTLLPRRGPQAAAVVAPSSLAAAPPSPASAPAR